MQKLSDAEPGALLFQGCVIVSALTDVDREALNDLGYCKWDLVSMQQENKTSHRGATRISQDYPGAWNKSSALQHTEHCLPGQYGSAFPTAHITHTPETHWSHLRTRFRLKTVWTDRTEKESISVRRGWYGFQCLSQGTSMCCNQSFN